MKISSVLLGVAVGLVAAQAAADETDAPDMVYATRAQFLPLHDQGVESLRAPQGNAKMQYYGGPVMANANVVIVLWGSMVDPAVTSQLEGYFKAIVDSPWMDWLSEYNTPTQIIGRGHYDSMYTDTTASPIMTILDNGIQGELYTLFVGHKIPTPDNNTLYMVMFPPNTIVDNSGSVSCREFCAYHSTFKFGGQNVMYAVIPDHGRGCTRGCGTGTKFSNTCGSMSHELAEAVTDPAVGLSSGPGAPMAWYDPSAGEIGDVCTRVSTVNGVSVQTLWSNGANACVATRVFTDDFTLTASPATASLAAGGSLMVDVTTAVKSGSAQPVMLGAVGLPSGLTGTFNPTMVNAGGSATLTLSAPPTIKSAVVPINISGVAGPATHSATITLTLTGGTPDAGLPDARMQQPTDNGGDNGGGGCAVGSRRGGAVGGLLLVFGMLLLRRRRRS